MGTRKSNNRSKQPITLVNGDKYTLIVKDNCSFCDLQKKYVNGDMEAIVFKKKRGMDEMFTSPDDALRITQRTRDMVANICKEVDDEQKGDCLTDLAILDEKINILQFLNDPTIEFDKTRKKFRVEHLYDLSIQDDLWEINKNTPIEGTPATLTKCGDNQESVCANIGLLNPIEMVYFDAKLNKDQAKLKKITDFERKHAQMVDKLSQGVQDNEIKLLLLEKKAIINPMLK